MFVLKDLMKICCLMMCAQMGFSTDIEQRIESLQTRMKDNHQKIEALKKIQTKQMALLNDMKAYYPKAPRKANFWERDYERFLPLPEAKFQLVAPNQVSKLRFRFLGKYDNNIIMDTRGLSIVDGISAVPIPDRNVVNRSWIFNLRPQLELIFNPDVTMFINPDFGRSQARIFDAFVDVHRYRLLGARVGKQLSLVAGFENTASAAIVPTMYGSYTTFLAPNREMGMAAYGSFGPSEPANYNITSSYYGLTDLFAYQLGIFNGNPDNTNPGLNPTNVVGASAEIATIDPKAFEARVFTNPFINLQVPLLKLFGLGASASTETVNNQGSLPTILTVGYNPAFSYLGNVNANGKRARIHPFLFWRYNQVALIMDYTQTLQYLTPGPIETNTNHIPLRQMNKANQIQFLYNLTGERVSLYEMAPNRDLNFNEKGAYGALQLVLRVTGMHLDSSVFNDKSVSNNIVTYVYADPRLSVSQANSWSVGLNWYWNRNIRFSTEYEQTTFIGGCSTGAMNAPTSPGCVTGFLFGRGVDSSVINRPHEKMFSQRFQVFF
jgi:phosphate-selective porin OprO and OprP